MKCRKNVRKLIADYNAAVDKTTTELMRFRQALLALKAAPSQLPSPHTQVNRYDDYVYIHQQSMAGHGNSDPGPHPGHRGPAFFPWHREFLRHFENDLRAASGNPDVYLPYWDWSVDRQPGDPGYPFIDDFLGGDGVGPGIVVQTGVFASANGWTLNIADAYDNNAAHQAELDSLQRSLSTFPPRADVIDSLAVNTYDVSPWNRDSGPSSFRNKVEGWPAAFTSGSGSRMHNRVHVGIGGSMLPGTSPNDPAFFLNHAKEDELWAVWMQKYPTVAHYLPADSEPLPPGHTHLVRLSDHMESLAEYFGAGTIDRPIDLLNHKAIAWYDTDLPEITLESGPAVAFNQTPEGLTVAKLIRFRVKSCRTVYFHVTGAPTGNFSVFGGPSWTVVPLEANNSEVLEIEVRFHAIGPDVQVSAIDIEAQITDEEGYYAANQNDPFTVATFHVELVANDIVTSDSSIVLVLDRSGSMSDVANSGFTKSQLLKSATGVVHELMKDTDEIGIARFDHESDVLLPMTLKSAGLGTTLTGTGLDPRGATSIGAGILTGSGLINGPGATKPNKAMVVLTDGNENTMPLISGLPAGTINQTTFAIGFGLPGQVSDPILDQISANSGGYLLVTGNMNTDAERFALAKYFIQILKDATLNQTVLDPEGILLWGGAPQEIAFDISDTDISADVVLLCALPEIVDFTLRTPGGVIVHPSDSGVEPNVRYVNGQEVAYYRLMLPALVGNAGGSHRGTWKAILRWKSRNEILQIYRKWSEQRKMRFVEQARLLVQQMRKGAAYTLTVHTYSNLRLDARLQLSGYAPGASIRLEANLFEYDLPLRSAAQVTADVVEPDGRRSTIAFASAGTGAYSTAFPTTRPGVYKFTIRASGYTTGNDAFTREKVLTAGVWAGGDQPYNPQTGTKDERMCELVHCVLKEVRSSEPILRALKKAGLDLDAIIRCFDKHCRQSTAAAAEVRAEVRELSAAPQIEQMMISMVPSTPSETDVLTAAKTKPVVRKAKKPPVIGNLFELPEDNRRE